MRAKTFTTGKLWRG